MLEHALQTAHTASARRDHATASACLASAFTLLDGLDPVPAARTAVLLELAGSHLRAGHVALAWDACRMAADAARDTADWAAMADAAVVLRGTGSSSVTAQVHALCIEALAMLDDSDPVRSRRVRAQLSATGSIWVSNPYFDLEGDIFSVPGKESDPLGGFLELQAWHARYLGCEHVNERLLVAGAAVDLGRREGIDEFLAWGLLWRIEALLQLARVVDVTAECGILASVAERMQEPLWAARVELLHAVLLHLEGRYTDALARADRAAEIGHMVGDESIGMLHLVMSTSIAVLTGQGLAEAEAAVRESIAGMPFSARGWLVEILAAGGKTAEAKLLWKAVAPHIHEFPRRAPEWIIAAASNVKMCVLFRDLPTAARLYADLLPYDGLLAVADALTPSSPPVSYHLGLLSALLGRPEKARQHFLDALELAEGIAASPFAELARRELIRRRTPGLKLTDRELEVAALVATGQSNRSIAQALFLSERTVESHVGNVLRKLDMPSRAAIAAWQAGQSR